MLEDLVSRQTNLEVMAKITLQLGDKSTLFFGWMLTFYNLVITLHLCHSKGLKGHVVVVHVH